MAKVLLCVHQFYPRFYTGTEALTLSVAEELKKRGHQVVIFTAEPYRDGPDIPDFIEDGWREAKKQSRPILRKDIFEEIPVWRIFMADPADPLELLDKESNQCGLAEVYKKLILDEQPEVVHVFHLMRFTGTFVETVKDLGIPIFFTTTDFWMLCPTYQLIRHNGELCTGPDPSECFLCMIEVARRKVGRFSLKFRLAKCFPRLAAFANSGARTSQTILQQRIKRHRRIIKLFDGVFWSNAFLRDMFHKNGLINSNERIVSFPVPERSRELFNLSMPGRNKNLRVAFIGTLQPSKGPQVLLEAFTKIGRKEPVRLSIWGPEVYPYFLDKLKRTAAGDERIVFRGTFEQEKFADVLRETDVVVVPSLWYENTPLTAISVLAAKRVLVASDLGGLATLVDNGHNGILFPAGDAAKLSEILIRLTRNRELIFQTVANISPPSRVEQYVGEILKLYPDKFEGR